MSRVSWLVLATHVPPTGHLGGIVRYTTELVAGLARRDDVQVSALTTRASADVLSALVGDPRRVHVLPDAPTLALSAYERLAWATPAGIDVVHGVKQLLPRRTTATTVLTAHDMLLLDRPQDFGRAKRTLLPAPYRASLRSADVVLAVSRATAQRVAAYLPEVAERTAVVPLATASDLLDGPPEPVPALAGRPYALVVGDSSPRKNLSTLVAAWPRVLSQRPDAVLAVVGPPSWGRSETGEAWAQLIRAGAILPLGRVPDAQLRWCYEHSAVVLCPSLAEGFGLPAAEALALGCRLVVSDDPALQEVAAGRAAVVSATDVAGWSAAVARAFAEDGPRPSPAARRTWDDVVADTVAAVLGPR